MQFFCHLPTSVIYVSCSLLLPIGLHFFPIGRYYHPGNPNPAIRFMTYEFFKFQSLSLFPFHFTFTWMSRRYTMRSFSNVCNTTWRTHGLTWRESCALARPSRACIYTRTFAQVRGHVATCLLGRLDAHRSSSDSERQTLPAGRVAERNERTNRVPCNALLTLPLHSLPARVLVRFGIRHAPSFESKVLINRILVFSRCTNIYVKNECIIWILN